MTPGNSHNFTLFRISCFIDVITIVMCDLCYKIKFITTQFGDVKYISMGTYYRSIGKGGKESRHKWTSCSDEVPGVQAL